MGDAVESSFGRKFEYFAEIGSWQGEFITADAKSHYTLFAKVHCNLRHIHGGSSAELAHAIENPLNAKPEFLVRADGLADCLEIFEYVLLAKKHHAGGERNLSINHVLR